MKYLRQILTACGAVALLMPISAAQRGDAGHDHVLVTASSLNGTIIQTQAGKLIHVKGATVEVHRLSDDQVLSAATSGDDGSFALPMLPMGTNVLVIVNVN